MKISLFALSYNEYLYYISGPSLLMTFTITALKYYYYYSLDKNFLSDGAVAPLIEVIEKLRILKNYRESVTAIIVLFEHGAQCSACTCTCMCSRD